MALNISFQDAPKLLTGNPASYSSSEPDVNPLGLRLTPISNKLARFCHALIFFNSHLNFCQMTANAVSPSVPLPNPSVVHRAAGPARLRGQLGCLGTANDLFKVLHRLGS